MTNQNVVLTAVLDCCVSDLYILDDIRYDLEDIVDALFASGIKPTLNAITDAVFCKGAEELRILLRIHIAKLEAIWMERERTKEEEEEFDALCQLDVENDVDWHCNCWDTDIYFVRHEDVYRKYLAEEIEKVEEHIGFEF